MRKHILKKNKKTIPPIEEIAETLYDKQLSFTDYEIVKINFINRLVGDEGLEPPTFSV